MNVWTYIFFRKMFETGLFFVNVLKCLAGLLFTFSANCWLSVWEMENVWDAVGFAA